MCQSIQWTTMEDKQTAIQVIKSGEPNIMQSDWMLMKVTIPEIRV